MSYFMCHVSSHFEFFNVKEGKYICMVSNEIISVDKIIIMLYNHQHKKTIVKFEVRGYIHNNKKQQKKTTKCYSHVPAL